MIYISNILVPTLIAFLAIATMCLKIYAHINSLYLDDYSRLATNEDLRIKVLHNSTWCVGAWEGRVPSPKVENKNIGVLVLIW